MNTKKLRDDNLMLMGRIQQLEKELEEKRKPIKDEEELRRLEKEMARREMRHSKTLDATRAEVIREAMEEMEELNCEHKRQMEELESTYQIQTESLKQTVDLMEKEAKNLQERTDYELAKKNTELEDSQLRISELTSQVATLTEELTEYREEERKMEEYNSKIATIQDRVKKTQAMSDSRKWERLASGKSAGSGRPSLSTRGNSLKGRPGKLFPGGRK